MSRQHMTLIACSNCRKKRTKCDGKTPCGRCTARDEKCCYESKMWRTKGQLRAEVDSLRTRLRQAHAVLGALASKDDYHPVLRRLRKGEAVATIAKGLPAPVDEIGEPHPSAASDAPSPSSVCDEADAADSWSLADFPASPESHTKDILTQNGAENTGLWPAPSQICFETADDATETSKTSFCSSPSTDVFSAANAFSASTPATSVNFSGRSPSLYSLPDWVDSTTKVGNWTAITNDDHLIRQLLSFYFSWEHSVFALLCKEPFQNDFENGRQRYCSSALVNAILAFACRFLDFSTSVVIDTNGLADRFFEESRRLIALEEDKTSLTRIQAIALLSLREATQGRETESRVLARECAELAARVTQGRVKEEAGDDEYLKVKATTICGALSLYRMLSLVKASSAFLPMNFDERGTGDSIPDDTPLNLLDDLQVAFSTHLPGCEPSSKLMFELTDLAYTSLFELFIRKRPIKGEDLMAAYTKYLSWYDSTFQTLRPEVACTPAVLFLHIYFQFCLMLLFRPFVQFNIIGSDFSTRAVCLEAAQAISTLTSSYSRLFTLRRAPCFLPCFVMVATMAQVSPELLPNPHLCDAYGLQQVGAHEQLEGSPFAMTTPFWAASPIHADGVTALVVGTSQLADMSECHPSAAEGVRALVEVRAVYGTEILQ
ncbi:Transcription factor [Pleurostoma richardsiae]|uniref:Transcription factor n=1 Tax=Pleurostoma richardsiae TaxID=41990 RepID=A0AA38R570_9PEZI|nr:Transcription factor [Pleurostoma richardsiae]